MEDKPKDSDTWQSVSPFFRTPIGEVQQNKFDYN